MTGKILDEAVGLWYDKGMNEVRCYPVLIIAAVAGILVVAALTVSFVTGCGTREVKARDFDAAAAGKVYGEVTKARVLREMAAVEPDRLAPRDPGYKREEWRTFANPRGEGTVVIWLGPGRYKMAWLVAGSGEVRPVDGMAKARTQHLELAGPELLAPCDLDADPAIRAVYEIQVP